MYMNDLCLLRSAWEEKCDLHNGVCCCSIITIQKVLSEILLSQINDGGALWRNDKLISETASHAML
jgi:hypothetical protein